MFKKRVFTVLLTAVLVLGISATAFAVPGKGNGFWKFHGQGKMKGNQLTDVGSHWAAQPIEAMCLQGVITGYPDFTFKPNAPVSKYEALTMISRAAGFNDSYNDDNRIDSDVPAWMENCLDFALDKGIITEEEMDGLKDWQPAKRYEVAVWAARAMGLEGDDELPFQDKYDVPPYARAWVGGMFARQYMVGYPGHFFQPNKPVTRAELAVIMYRIMLQQPAGEDFSRVVNGVVDDVYSDSIKIEGKTYDLANDATVRVDGEKADLGDVKAGARVTVYLDKDGNIMSLYARNVDENNNNNLEIDKLTPADGSDNVDPDTSKLVAHFNMAIKAVDDLDSVKSGVRVRNVTNGEYADIDEVSIDNEELIIDLKDSLDNDKTYRVTVDGDVLEAENSGENFDGISGSEWEFSTFDSTSGSLTIVDLIPEDGDDNVDGPDTDELQAGFSDDIRVVSGKSLTGAVKVYNKTDDEDVDVESVKIDGDTLIITLKYHLEKGDTYQVTIKSDYLEEKDTGSNFKGISGSDWSFTTSD
ncbi:MAG: Ig-like domain-containing protein [Eubacteriales bacterium]